MIVYKVLRCFLDNTHWSIFTPVPFALEYKQGETTHAHPDTELFVFDTCENATLFVASSGNNPYHEIWTAETDTVHKIEFIHSIHFLTADDLLFTADDLRAWWKSERRGEFPVPTGTLTTPSLTLLERIA